MIKERSSACHAVVCKSLTSLEKALSLCGVMLLDLLRLQLTSTFFSPSLVLMTYLAGYLIPLARHSFEHVGLASGAAPLPGS
jgi:hypothetical protein